MNHLLLVNLFVGFNLPESPLLHFSLPLLFLLLEKQKLKSHLSDPDGQQNEKQRDHGVEVEDEALCFILKTPEEKVTLVTISEESEEPDEGADGEVQRDQHPQHPKARVSGGDQETDGETQFQQRSSPGPGVRTAEVRHPPEYRSYIVIVRISLKILWTKVLKLYLPKCKRLT